MPSVIAIGEILWDMFPNYRRLGGAAANFVWHCHCHGLESSLISRVGVDALGQEIGSLLKTMEIPAGLVSVDNVHPTGTVQVTLDATGQPSYEIVTGVAWDYIACDTAELTVASTADAVCFGALAQRNDVSRRSIQRLVAATPESAIRIFDVNLRQHYYSQEVIGESLRLANVLKLNDEELPVMASMFGLTGDTTTIIRQLIAKFDLRLVAFTRGKHGSMMVTAENVWDHPGYPCQAVDSVGAGDSFTATVCAGLLRNMQSERINDWANRVAAFVCSQQGATPVLPDELLKG